MALALAALEALAVTITVEVDIDGVSVLRAPVHGQDAGIALLHRGQLLVDLLVFDLYSGFICGEALVFTQGHLGIQRHLIADGHRLIFVQMIIRDSGVPYRAVSGILAAGLERVQRQGVNGVLVKHVAAVHALDDHAGGLALAEAGHHDPALGLQVCLVYGRLKGLRVDRDLEGQLAIRSLNIFRVHGCIPPIP